MTDDEYEVMLHDECAKFYADPLGFVLWAFDWDVGELAGFDGPDTWQIDVLTDVGNAVKQRRFDGVNPVDPIRYAVSSGHGIGKSAISAWLILWIMSTRPHSKGVVTANTGDQLRTKTMSELAKWRKRCITGHWFEQNAMSISHVSHADTWRVDAQTCREENSEAFAGLHCADSTPWYLFDEASNIPSKIWEVAQGGLTDGEPMHFAFGNPTRNSGEFFQCFNAQRHRWMTRRIDSRTAKMSNKAYLNELIDDYGLDSDRVRVRVLGQFPKASDAQFIPNDIVQDSRKRGSGRYLGDDPLICGFDVARGGGDDCYIVFRRGKDAVSEKVYRIPPEKSRDSMKVVSIMTMLLERHKPDVTFIDETGIGGPVCDRLAQLGYHVIGVHFGGKAADDKHYVNRAAEMWDRMKRWLFDGGSIPDDQLLEDDLTQREYGHDQKDRLKLESKDEMKKRGLHSPDWADALALTFAEEVPPRQLPRDELDNIPGQRDRGSDYDPLDAVS